MHARNILLTCGESRTADAIAHLLLERDDFKRHVSNLVVTLPPDLDNPDLTSVGATILNLPSDDVTKSDADLAAMFKGADVAILIPPAATNKFDQVIKIIEAIKNAEIKNVILLSSQGCHSGKPRLTEFLKLEHAAKRMIPECNLCILRSGHYMQNLFLYAKQMREEGIFGVPMGEGEFAPVDDRDVGMCAAKISVSGEGKSIGTEHIGETYLLTGPELITGADIAKNAKSYLTEAGLKPVQYKSIDKGQWVNYIVNAVPGVDSSEVEVLGEQFDLIREGKMAEMSMDFGWIIPEQTRTTLSEFFEEYAELFSGKEE